MWSRDKTTPFNLAQRLQKHNYHAFNTFSYVKWLQLTYLLKDERIHTKKMLEKWSTLTRLWAWHLKK